MEFLYSILYLAFLGIVSYPVGRVISRYDPDPDGFLFRERAWELGGRVYEKLNIKKWQAKVPDISKVLGRWMPKKKLDFGINAEKVRIMIRETCTAELAHSLLNVAGLWLIGIWEGIGGWIMFLIYVLFGNMPFILVQRYNRPRLKLLHQRLELKEASVPAVEISKD